MTLKLGIQHWVLKFYQICSKDDTGLTLTIFMTWSNLFPNASAWVKAYMYFQACSNLAYPMQSDERCNPLVLWFIYDAFNMFTVLNRPSSAGVTLHDIIHIKRQAVKLYLN